jgi:formylglycine-generating enzyme required for sulfatase activity
MAQQQSPSWLDVLGQLLGKLRSQLFIFVLATVIVLALIGSGIPSPFITLIYILVIAALVIWALPVVTETFRKLRPAPSTEVKPLPGIPQPAPTPSLPAAPKPEPPPQTLSTSEQLQAYLNKVKSDNDILRLGGLSSEAGDPTKGPAEQRVPPRLSDVFISLFVTGFADEQERKRSSELMDFAERDKKPPTALEVLGKAESTKAVLLGLPGSGKTSVMRHLAYHLAEARLSTTSLQASLPEWKADAVLPVLVTLARLADALPEKPQPGLDGAVRQFIQDDVEKTEALRGIGPALWQTVKERGALFLFDGLDEVAVSKRAVVKRAITGFMATRANCRAVVTCRTFSYGDAAWQLEGWPAFNLAPLEEEQQADFIEKWYGTLARNDPPSATLYADRAQTLRRAILERDARQLHEIAPNPLILTLICKTHTYRVLPGSRVSIYKECVGLLLLEWQVRRSPDAPLRSVLDAMTDAAPDKPADILQRRLLDGLCEVAFEARDGRGLRQGETTLVDEGLLLSTLMPKIGEAATRVFIAYCREANGLLLAQGVRRLPQRPAHEAEVECFAFPHPSFEEYLAAQYLETWQDESPYTALAHRNAVGDRWFYVGLFLAETKSVVKERWSELLTLVEALLPPNDATAPAWRNIWLAGECWRIFRRDFEHELGRDRAVHTGRRALDYLTRLVTEGQLRPAERADAGIVLSRLGDPRDLEELVPVPAGPFIMGADDLGDDSKPKHPVTLDHDFRIGKYPVTVGLWRRYCDATHYTPDPDSLKAPDNHPVIDISWHEARAFCDWLTEAWRTEGRISKREKVKLPSEAEWEKAARGTDGRAYPWGSKFNEEHANTTETGIGRTCAVGSFPAGASPCGALDMAGNVWEWTTSLWGKDFGKPQFKYPYDPKDERRENIKAKDDILRVVRGGSILNRARSAQCAFRSGDVPPYRVRDIGFRVVVVPL